MGSSRLQKSVKNVYNSFLEEKRIIDMNNYVNRKNKEKENNKILENRKYISSLKSDWKRELSEGMTTGGGEIQFAPTDVPLDTIDAADTASFTAAYGGFDSQSPADGLSGAQIISNGTGSGNNGGFNIGRNYLSFNGVGFDDSLSPEFDNKRHVLLTPVDASRATTLEITAIVGNNSNGGEAPSVGQDITLWYTDNENYPGFIIGAYDETTFEPVVVVPHNGSGSLKNYSVTIPSYLRRSGIQFVLFQDQGNNPTTTNDNYGVTEITLKRTTPISVIAPLDSPEAVSFIRVGTGPNIETPEQRYRRITQQLLASKNYTNKTFGSNFPGSNFSGISGVSASPIGKDEMMAAYARMGKQYWSGSAGPITSTQRNRTLSAPTSDSSKQLMKNYQGQIITDRDDYWRNVTNVSPQEFDRIRQAKIASAESQPTVTYQGGLKTAGKVTGTSPISSAQVQQPQLQPQLEPTVTYQGGLKTAGKVTGTSPLSSRLSVPPTPPKTQTQPRLTPQQVSDLDKQIRDLQKQSEKSKQNAINNQWRAVGELAMGVLQAAAILSPIPGDEVVVAAALAAKTGPKAAGVFTKANPGKYNPFLSQQTNKYLNLPKK